MKSFKQLNEAPEKKVVFTFGRFNPPTTGHEKLISKVKSVAGSDDFKIYPSYSQNAKKDPLPHALKVAYMRKMFPQHAKSIIADKDSKTAINVAVKLYNQGYRDVTMVVGSDRVNEFKNLLTTYNGVEGKRHGFYKFDKLNVVSAGERDPDAEGVEGMSASKMRAAAADGDVESFMKGLPSGFKDGKKLYRDVRKHMGIREEKDLPIETDEESLRDAYLTGKLWKIGDTVHTEEHSGTVISRGTNYLSFIDEEKNIHKVWLHEVRQDPDIKDRKGTQPAKYHSGLSKSTKTKRDAHFQKGREMDDDNPAAYKPAPGDKDAKTKPSKYTQKYKAMFGEAPLNAKRETILKYVLNDIEKKAAKNQYDINFIKQVAKLVDKEVADKGNKRYQYEETEQELTEKIKGLVNKSEKSGIAYSILKKVYDRGIAAWRTGHRPGTTPQQWAFARVNSFITGGGARKSDNDQWQKHKGRKEAFEIGKDYADHTRKVTPDYIKKLKKEDSCCDDCEELFDHVITEAEYQGKTVKLNDPIRTNEVPTKKFKVYVKDGDKVKVVRFGDPNMDIKRDDPARRKNFRARHNCANPGPKTKARYWSCYQWRGSAKVDN